MGALDTITYVQALPDGRLFAAGDDGGYFVQAADGQWSRHAFGQADAHIVQLVPLDAYGFALVTATTHMPTTARPPRTTVYVKRRLDEDGAGQQVLRFDEASAMASLGTVPLFFDGKELRVYFSHAGMSRRTDLHRIDAESLQDHREQLDYWVTGIYRLSAKDLVMNRVTGLSRTQSFSADNGHHWRHGGKSPDAYWVQYVTPTRAYGYVVKSMGWNNNSMALAVTRDSGATWSGSGVPFEGEGFMPLRLVDGRLFVMTGRKILSITDEGASWHTEWPLAAASKYPS